MSFSGGWRSSLTSEALVVESWGQGLLVGSLTVMACVTVANMRKGVLLHKLILVEVSRDIPTQPHPPDTEETDSVP